MVALVVVPLVGVTIGVVAETVVVGVGVVDLDTVMGSQFEFIGLFISKLRGTILMGA